MKSKKNKGQSLIEVIIALTVGAIFIATAAGAISVSLRSNFDSRSLQTANNLAQETIDNISAIGESNWYKIYNLNKGSNSKYYINSSRQIIVAGINDETVVVDGKSYKRYFTIENVYRNSCGVGDIDSSITSPSATCPINFPGGASDFDEDISTQKITVSVELNGLKKANLVKYISRFQNSVFSQKDWSAGANQAGFGELNKFYSSNNIISSVPGEISLGNLSWGAKIIDTNAGQYPSIIAPDKNNIFISYKDFTAGGLEFIKSTDGGNNWPIETIVDAAGSGYSSIGALDLNKIFISYYNNNLKFASSINGGATWTIKTIDSTGGAGFYSSIAVVKNSNTIFIGYYQAFSNNALKFIKSTDGGVNWTAPIIIESGSNIGSAPSIYALDQNNIFVSYYDGTAGNLKFAKSINGGNNWTTGIVIASGASPSSIVAVDTNTIFAAYYAFNSASAGFSKSTDGGNAWASSIIAANAMVGGYPAIAALGANAIFVSYLDISANQRVSFAKSTDGGNNWTTTRVEETFNVNSPSISVADADNIFISYYDFANKYLKFANSITSYSSGDLTSSTFDTQSSSTVNSIIWQGNLNGGVVKFQIAISNCQNGANNYPSCNASIGWGDVDTPYQGPSGSASYFGTGSSPGDSIKINSKIFNNYRYFRYKINLEPNFDSSATPIINNVIINWSP